MKLLTYIFIIIISTSIGSTLIISFTILNFNSSTLEEKINQQLKAKSVNVLDIISESIFDRMIDIKIISDQKSSLLDHEDLSSEKNIEILKNVERATKSYFEISIYDKYGIKVASTRNLKLGSDDSDEVFFNKAASGQIHIDSTPHFSEDLNQYVLKLSAPLYNEKEELSGVLVATYPTSRLNNIIDQEKFFENEHVELLSEDGVMIFSNYDKKSILSKEYLNHPLFAKLTHTTNNERSVTEINENYFSIMTKEQGFLDYEGKGWILFIEIPHDVVFQQVTYSRNVIIAFSLFATVVIATIAYFTSKYLSNSINKVGDYIHKIAKGNFNARTKVSPIKEVQELKDDLDYMTKQLQLYQQIAIKSERLTAIGQLAARLNHDLRNPLSALKNSLQIIESTNTFDEKTMKYISLMKKQIDRMTYQINDVLGFVKTKPLKLEHIHLSEILNNTIGAFNLPKNIHITLPTNDVLIFCDSFKMQTVFSNIIKNAIDAIEEKDENITIRAKDDNKNIILEIENTGTTIPDELLPKIFDPLVTTKQSGTGLGLTSCKNIIEEHGGTITVKNNPVTFTITLPKAQNLQSAVTR